MFYIVMEAETRGTIFEHDQAGLAKITEGMSVNVRESGGHREYTVLGPDRSVVYSRTINSLSDTRTFGKIIDPISPIVILESARQITFSEQVKLAMLVKIYRPLALDLRDLKVEYTTGGLIIKFTSDTGNKITYTFDRGVQGMTTVMASGDD